MPTITLVLAQGHGFPAGSAAHRYVFDAAFDASGRLDVAAWRARAVPWAARRLRPDAPPREGDVQHDEETGWSLRFPAAGPEGEMSVPLVHAGVLRPGEHVTLREDGGVEHGYRVVGIG